MARRFASRGRTPLGRGATLEKRWLPFRASFGAVSAGSIGVLIANATDSTDTVMRTRATLLAYLDGVEDPGTLIECTVALHVVPEGTGTTVIADPISDGNAGRWFYYSTFALGYEEGVVNVLDYGGAAWYREVLDVKAMRISKPDTELQAVLVNTTIQGAGNLNCTIQGRILLGR